MMEMVGTKQMTSPSSFRCGPIRERGEQGRVPEVLSDSWWSHKSVWHFSMARDFLQFHSDTYGLLAWRDYQALSGMSQRQEHMVRWLHLSSI